VRGMTWVGKYVTFTSSDSSIAQVVTTGYGSAAGASGQLTARAPGKAVITATSWSNTSDTMTVTVLDTSKTGQGVAVFPGQSIQAAVNANPAGTTFVLKAGTHQKQTVVPKSGDVFIGETGTVLDGGNSVAFAFDKGDRLPYPSNVRIQGLVIQNYAPGFQKGAINGGTAGGRASAQTTGWVVSACEVHHNRGAGLNLGHRMQVLNNSFHHNDQIGVRGSGDDILFQGNEVASNNPGWHYGYTGTGREFGGIKFSHTHGLVARGNYVHDNNGNGFWTDIDNLNALYEGNRAVGNAGVGIIHEISYAVIVRNNVATGNGTGRGGAYGAGILISNSRDAEVYGNTVTGNKMGITANELDRGTGLYGPYEVRNLYVHDNTIQTAGQTGIQAGGGGAVYTSWNNRFRNNTYTGLKANRTPFLWLNGRKTVEQWKGYGQDVTGKFLQ
jgi:Right handed beta helix region